jgi:hypothetical protein
MNISQASVRNKWLILPAVLILGLVTAYAVREFRNPDTTTPPVAEPSSHTSATPAEGPTTAREEATPEAPPVARAVVIPAGTVIRGSLSESLSTEGTPTGEEFSLKVFSPIVIDGINCAGGKSHQGNGC